MKTKDKSMFVFVGLLLLVYVIIGLMTGCSTARKLFPEATKEATTVAPELQKVTDKKAAETIRKGKAEAVEKVERL